MTLHEEFESYVAMCRPPIRAWLEEKRDVLDNGRCGGSHSGRQRSKPDGLKYHLVDVCRRALEWNQTCDPAEVVECVLVHDLPDPFSAPLSEAQRVAINATKGLPYREWRPTPVFRFVALILIADMWSAFVNERDIDSCGPVAELA